MTLWRTARRIAAITLLLVAPLCAQADSWRFDRKIASRTFEYGPAKIVLTTDATKDQVWPDFTLEIYNGSARVALLPGVGVDQVFASPDNQIFVGLSNSGLPGTAVIVFTATGTVRLLVVHNIAEFDYCRKTVTLQRVWYDQENPSVRFALDGATASQGIFLRDCRGNEIELMATVRKALVRGGAR